MIDITIVLILLAEFVHQSWHVCRQDGVHTHCTCTCIHITTFFTFSSIILNNALATGSSLSSELNRSVLVAPSSRNNSNEHCTLRHYDTCDVLMLITTDPSPFIIWT